MSRTDLSGLKAFRETYSNNEIMAGLIFYAGSEVYKVDEFTTALPWNLI